MLVPRGGRYLPVSLGENWYLQRPRLTRLVSEETTLVLVCAKAGQGKSVLGASLFDAEERARYWYRLDQSDNDPGVFLQRFSVAFDDAVHAAVAAAQRTAQPDLDACFDAVARELAASGTGGTIFIDDFHCLDPEGVVAPALARFSASLEEDFRFVVMSRNDVPELGIRLARQNSVRIDDHMLAFEVDEAIDLFDGHEGSDIARSIDLREICMGWPLALGEFRKYLSRSSRTLDDILDRCFQSLLSFLDKAVQAEVYQLSLLSRFPLESARQLEPLGDLLDREAGGCSFNPRFRDFLARRRSSELSPEQLRLALEASVVLSKRYGRYADTIEQLCALGDFDQLDELFEKSGELVSPEDWAHIVRQLDEVGEDRLSACGSVMLYWGRFSGERNPRQAETRLVSSRQIFERVGDAGGQLKARGFLLELHLDLLDQVQLQHNYETLQSLRRAHPLQWQGLSVPLQIVFSIQLAGASIYLLSDSNEIGALLDTAQSLLGQEPMPNERALIYCFRALNHIFNRRVEPARICVDQIADIDSAELRESVKINIAGTRGYYLALTGRYRSLRFYLEDVSQALDQHVLDYRQHGGFFKIWLAQFELLSGDDARARDMLGAMLESPIGLVPGDSRTMGTILYAIALANTGDASDARRYLGKIDTLSGTLNYRYRQRLSLATLYITLSDFAQANEMLEEIIDESYPNYPFFTAVAHGIHAYSLHLQGRQEDSAANASRWLELVAGQLSPGFLSVGYTFNVLAFLLKVNPAGDNELPASNELMLRIKRHYLDAAFDEERNPIPRLQITSAPRQNVSIGGVSLVLTRSQRRLLFVLAMSTDRKMSKVGLLEMLWGEKDGSENRLDAVISRTRKVFSDAGHDARNYLDVSPGELQLINTSIDFVQFREMIEDAESQKADRGVWLMNCLKFSALNVWPGYFDEELDELVSITDRRIRDIESYQSTCIDMSMSQFHSDEHVRFLVSSLETLHLRSPESQLLARALVGVYQARNDFVSSYKVEQRFVDGLRSLDLEEAEVRALRAALR